MYPDFATPFVLYYTNASDTAIGTVLSQFQNSNEVVIGYWSCQLTKAERNHFTIKCREAIAVVDAVKEFYLYLYGFKLKLIMDHNPLTSLKDLKDVSEHLVQWMLYLQQCEYSVEHRPCKNHANGLDCLLPAPYSLCFNS